MCTHICIYLHVSQQELDTRRIVATGKHWDKKQQHEQSIVRNVLVIVSKPKRRSTFQSQTEGGKRKGEKVTLTPILDLLLSPIRKIPPETPGNPPPPCQSRTPHLHHSIKHIKKYTAFAHVAKESKCVENVRFSVVCGL